MDSDSLTAALRRTLDPDTASEGPGIDDPRFYGPARAPSPLARRTNLEQMRAKPFGINFYAPLSTRSGLGKAARGTLAAIRAAGILVELYNINYDTRPMQVAADDRDRPGPYRINLVQVNADTIEHVMSMFQPGQFDNAYTIAIWAWELNVLRPDWYPAFAAVDEVWGLSDFNAASIAALSPVPVRTMCPPVLNPPIRPEHDRSYFGLPGGFLFLTAFDVGSSLDRKNPYAVIEAFDQVSGEVDDVHLLLKFHSEMNDVPAVRALMQTVRDRHRIIVRSEKLSDTEMGALQLCADCLVSAHRAEGFGLNIAEFMLTGRPVIATGYSGNMSFTTKANSYLLSYELRPLERSSGPYLPGYLWAEPDTAQLARLMRHVVDNPSEANQIGALGAATVKAQFSIHAVGARIRDRLELLGLSDAAAKFTLRPAPLLRLPPPFATRPLHIPADIMRHSIISVVVAVQGPSSAWLQETIASVQAQTYSRWELCLCTDAATFKYHTLLRRYQGIDPRIRIMHLPQQASMAAMLNAAVTMATGGFLMLLTVGDTLTPDATYQLSRKFATEDELDVLYANEADIGALEIARSKPDWSIEHLESSMYAERGLVVRTRLFLRLGGLRAEFDDSSHDLLLRLSRTTKAVAHIDRVLYHRRPSPPNKVDVRAIEDHARIMYGEGQTSVVPQGNNTVRVRHIIRNQPTVSVVVFAGLADTDPVEAIRAGTRYPLQSISVINRSVPWAIAANRGLWQAPGQHVVCMDSDLVVFDPDWLAALLEFSQNPEIGLCGGQIVGPDEGICSGEIQGGPVTDLPMIGRRETLRQVGGFNVEFGSYYSTLDLSLRLSVCGYRTVHTPFAQLRRHQAKPAAQLDPKEAAAFQIRWGKRLTGTE